MSSDYVTTRIVLHQDDERTQEHSPDANEYETLHAEMHARGFRRFAHDDADELMYQFPPGEYFLDIDAESGSDARDKALAKAKAAATLATSAKRYSVLCSGGMRYRVPGRQATACVVGYCTVQHSQQITHERASSRASMKRCSCATGNETSRPRFESRWKYSNA
ncbi:hypothetical protein [Burkholderia sp. BCC1047]|uniref:hypothetical protein n=1 Tax=Burkholderia sp. BCC1047 TaxID=2676299 RepID=UPI00158BFF54|nr:hypothetical protein [Burkholderia sp. BCC1047]